MDILRQDENEPDRDRYTDEPVFDLGDVSEPTEEGEADVQADVERQLSPAAQQLLTLFSPAALSLSGLIVAVLAAVTQPFSVWSLMTFGPLNQGQPSKGWLLGPVIAQGAIAVLLGLSSWRLALMTRAEVPRTAGAAVLLGVLLLVAATVLWMQSPASQ